MAKDIQTIKNQFQIIKYETVEDANTANRVGGAGYDLAEFVGENRTGIIPYFNTESELTASIPSPNEGEQAWAGTPYPGTVWSASDGNWTDTGVIPDVNGADLAQYTLNGGSIKTSAQLDKQITGIEYIINGDIGVNQLSVFNNGYFLYANTIGQSATVVANANLCYSPPIPVKIGDIVTCMSQGTGIACIATTDASGSHYTAKAISNDGNNIKEYKYTVEADGYVAVSSRIAAIRAWIYRYDHNASARIDNLSVKNIGNGKPKVYGDVSNFSGTSITERHVDENYLIYFRSGLGNVWIYSPIFNPTGQNLVHLKFKVEFEKVNTTTGIEIWIADRVDTSSKFKNLTSIIENGEYDITIDPAYYTVYEGYTQFCFWINNQTMPSSGSSIKAKISGLQVVEYTDSVNVVNISGNNVKELFESTDAQISNLKGSVNGNIDVVKISPSGNKFELSVQDDGSSLWIPIVPNKGSVFMNSLGFGWGEYGMAASAPDKDFYFRFTNFIQGINPAFTSTRNYISPFEGLTDTSGIEAAIQTYFLDKLAGDEDLVVIQIGDNVNTPQKRAVFAESLPAACRSIRQKCPIARVAVIGIWYANTDVYQIIQDASKLTGCRFISFADIMTKPNIRSAVGNLTRRGTATRILNNVTNVVANSATNITVSFTSGGTSYTSKPMDVTSYSLSSGNLTYTGQYQIIATTGEATHPGDDGFRLIANTVIYNLGLSDDPEQIKTT